MYGSSIAHSNPQPLTKQEMLANLKAKAEARKKQNGPEKPSDTLKVIESTTKPVRVTVPQTRGSSSGFRAVSALSRLRTGGRTSQSVRPFATVADPDVLVEAEVAPSTGLYHTELNVPDHLREDYDRFKTVCENNNIPAGLMGRLWDNLLRDVTIIDMDTSFSMATTDVQRNEPESQLEKNYKVDIKDYGENRTGYSEQPRRNRMTEARERLLEAMPIVCAANREGLIQLKSYARPDGITLDPKQESYESMVQRAEGFIRDLQPVTDHTPSVSSYLRSCKYAVETMRSGRAQSATIVEVTDGEPNERLKPEFESIYQNYKSTMDRGRDYIREDGARVPYEEAKQWNMDRKTPDLMRRFSVLAGHYAIPTTIAACTDNEDEIGEVNEVDALHNTVATLDDFKSEQQEVLRHQGPRVPFNLATYMTLYFLAPKEIFLDRLDEMPFTPDQLEQYMGYFPGHEAYVENLEMTQTAAYAQAESDGYSMPVATAAPRVIPTATAGNYTR